MILYYKNIGLYFNNFWSGLDDTPIKQNEAVQPGQAQTYDKAKDDCHIDQYKELPS
jgi:hypothetical protein